MALIAASRAISQGGKVALVVGSPSYFAKGDPTCVSIVSRRQR